MELLSNLPAETVSMAEHRGIPYYIVDVTGLDHPSALDRARDVIASMPKPLTCVVDVDGPLIPKASLRLGFYVGILPPPSINFLSWLLSSCQDTSTVLYTARPLKGRLAHFLNADGSAGKRIREALLSGENRKTELLRGLRELGISGENIVCPQGVKSIIFPLFKISDLLRLNGHMNTSLSHLLDPKSSLIYLADTPTDERVFRGILTEMDRASNERQEDRPQYKFVKFPLAYPLGIC